MFVMDAGFARWHAPSMVFQVMGGTMWTKAANMLWYELAKDLVARQARLRTAPQV